MSTVALERVSKSYGDFRAVDGVDLAVREGEFLTLLGPSGCGKTTILRMIAGLVEPSAGTIRIGDADVTRLPPQRRGLGMVFQDYALFPHMTIAENIAFGMVERGMKRDQIRARVAELIEMIRLPDAGARYPSQISGGQQQRVALARAVAVRPQVLLMDEPLGALDLKLREAIQVELRNFQRALSITTIYVTHDQVEAMTLSDRIAVLSHGRIEQLDTPASIYEAPKTRFVAGFVGKINFFEGEAAGTADGSVLVRSGGGVFRVPARDGIPDGRAVLAVRPEHLSLAPLEDGDDINRLRGTVAQLVYSGNLVQVLIALPTGEQVTAEARPAECALEPGADITLSWRARDGVLIRES